MKRIGRSRGWVSTLAVFGLIALGPLLHAHEGEPPVPEGKVALAFVPPPMDGTISLGVYDATGKLVRVLHREAPQSDFVRGVNGLITYWDGTDERGQTLPAGSFAARGYVVGAIGVEGEAFYFNDWIADEDSPRIRRVRRVQALAEGKLAVEAELADGGKKSFIREKSGSLTPAEMLPEVEPPDLAGIPSLEHPVAASHGKDGSIWVIDQTSEGAIVKQFTRDGEFLRRLVAAAGEPAPVQISAAPDEEAVLLLEENATRQRVRRLSLIPKEADKAAADAGPDKSVWRVDLNLGILSNETLNAIQGELKTAGSRKFKPVSSLTVSLMENDLHQEKKPTVQVVVVAINPTGSFLQLDDGLPLRRVSDTKALRWVAFGRDGSAGAVTVFQSDGAAVEEFTLTRLDQMMAFDCGQFSYPPAPAAAVTPGKP